MITAVGIVFVALFFPETRGLPLEEIEELLGNTQDIMVFTTPGLHGTEAESNGQDKAATEHLEV